MNNLNISSLSWTFAREVVNHPLARKSGSIIKAYRDNVIIYPYKYKGKNVRFYCGTMEFANMVRDNARVLQLSCTNDENLRERYLSEMQEIEMNAPTNSQKKKRRKDLAKKLYNELLNGSEASNERAKYITCSNESKD